MWKPGSKKPNGEGSGGKRRSKSKSKSPGRRNRQTDTHPLQFPSSSNKKNDEPMPQNADDALPNTKTGSSETAVSKKLSGSTMNMRFMQRHQTDRSSTGTARSSLESASSATTRDPEFSPTRNLKSSSSPKRSSFSSHQNKDEEMPDENDDDTSDSDSDDDDDVVMTEASSRFSAATASDMYGHGQVSLIGRRSFGGFNPTIAEAWQFSQQTADQAAMSSNNKKSKLSDKELVQRYQDMRKKANRQQEKSPRQSSPGRKKQRTSLS